MTTDLIEQPAPLTITADHLALVRNTIAKDATPDELQLFLYDCQRRNVHPLDRLLHFTKRSGRYTPITSIDFMRIRAAETNECAGIDDAIFSGTPKASDFVARVTVWRLVQGVRCAFTATAYWAEYKPESHDFMWMKMPHVMLGKVAEALALRRGFPQQLHGLYESAELAQSVDGARRFDNVDLATGEVTEAPTSITPAQQKRLFAIATKSGWSKDAMRVALKERFGVLKTAAIPQSRYEEICTCFSSGPPTEDPDPDDQPF